MKLPLRHKVGSKLRRFFNRPGPYRALNDLDRKLEVALGHGKGFYVELGANDGIAQSNTFALERKCGWRGVLIEPLPSRFVDCCRLRGKQNQVFCAACVPFDYPDRFVPMRYADLMSASKDLSTLDLERHYVSAAKYFPEGEAYEFGALARTLTSILDEAEAPLVIDLLSLDVEGAELGVLGGLDQERYTCRHILVETKNIDAIKDALPRHKLIDQLSYHDYLFREG